MKKLIVFAIVVLMLSFCFVACFSSTAEAAEPDAAMFTLLEKQQVARDEYAMVFVHNDTGVMYLLWMDLVMVA